jgi:4-amino-4-deoxy-L-arabinose transferase-like glycosyltransferase
LRVELASFALVFAAVCLPWYVQEYMRHGEPFMDRLLFHDMYKRAFVHVHDTNAGDDVSVRYYVWQLGYALFPWTGLVPLGIGDALSRETSAHSRKRDLGLIVALWLTLAFSLFSLALTKFHHYALPCAPPLAVLVAMAIERAFVERNVRLGLLAILAALSTLLVTRDLATTLPNDVPGSARLLHLFTYDYKRVWPSWLDFESALWGFGCVAALAQLALLAPRLRAPSAWLLGAIGVSFCAFTLWIYLPRLAPHYGQRELVSSYYRARRGPQEPLVAYQMNWKGENFYTGNRLPAFVSTGAKFGKWLQAQRRSGTRVMYFLTEHRRVGTLRSELGAGYRASKLTDEHSNDKFALVKVEVLPEPRRAESSEH